jgi:hypothetical protein
MGKSFAILLLLAGAALAQSPGGNYRGSLKWKLFRDLSTNRHGLFEGRADMAPRVLLAPNDVHVPGTSANCVVGLVEVPPGEKVVSRGDMDRGMIITPPPGNSGDPGIVIAPTLPTCPPRR